MAELCSNWWVLLPMYHHCQTQIHNIWRFSVVPFHLEKYILFFYFYTPRLFVLLPFYFIYFRPPWYPFMIYVCARVCVCFDTLRHQPPVAATAAISLSSRLWKALIKAPPLPVAVGWMCAPLIAWAVLTARSKPPNGTPRSFISHCRKPYGASARRHTHILAQNHTYTHCKPIFVSLLCKHHWRWDVGELARSPPTTCCVMLFTFEMAQELRVIVELCTSANQRCSVRKNN